MIKNIFSQHRNVSFCVTGTPTNTPSTENDKLCSFRRPGFPLVPALQSEGFATSPVDPIDRSYTPADFY